jgi:hypothetical protein
MKNGASLGEEGSGNRVKKRLEKVDEEKKANTIGAFFESLKPCPDRLEQPLKAGTSGESIPLDP